MCSQASRWAILLLLSLFPSYVGSESLCVASVLRWPFVYVCVCMCLPPRLSWTHHSSRLPTAACKQVLLPPTRPTAEDGSPMEDEHFLLLHVITPEQSGLLPRPAQMLIFTLTASFSLRNEGTVWGNAHAHSLAHSASWHSPNTAPRFTFTSIWGFVKLLVLPDMSGFSLISGKMKKKAAAWLWFHSFSAYVCECVRADPAAECGTRRGQRRGESQACRGVTPSLLLTAPSRPKHLFHPPSPSLLLLRLALLLLPTTLMPSLFFAFCCFPL